MTGLASQIADQAAARALRAPRELPLLMQPDLSRATWYGLKSNTRRMKGLDFINERPGAWVFVRWQDGYPDGKRRAVFRMPDGPQEPDTIGIHCPFGQAGDRLWVKENYRLPRGFDNKPPAAVPEGTPVFYAATLAHKPDWAGKVRVSIHMPRWASRMLLEITRVEVERLATISEADARAEGTAIDWERVEANGGATDGAVYPCAACSGDPNGIPDLCHPTGRGAPWRCVYANTWDAINPQAPWSLSPWVWSIHFRAVHPLLATERT